MLLGHVRPVALVVSEVLPGAPSSAHRSKRSQSGAGAGALGWITQPQLPVASAVAGVAAKDAREGLHRKRSLQETPPTTTTAAMPAPLPAPLPRAGGPEDRDNTRSIFDLLGGDQAAEDCLRLVLLACDLQALRVARSTDRRLHRLAREAIASPEWRQCTRNAERLRLAMWSEGSYELQPLLRASGAQQGAEPHPGGYLAGVTQPPTAAPRCIGLLHSVDGGNDGGTLAAGGDDGSVALWATPALARQPATFLRHRCRVSALAMYLAPPTREANATLLLASGGADGGIRLWVLPPRPEFHHLQLPRGTHTTSGPQRRDVHREASLQLAPHTAPARPGWENSAHPAHPAHELMGAHLGGVSALGWAGRGRLLSGGGDGAVRLWFASACGRRLHGVAALPSEHLARVSGLAGGVGVAVTCSDDRTVKLWSLEPLLATTTFRGHSSGVCCVAVHGNQVASGGANDSAIRLWDCRGAGSVATFSDAPGGVPALALGSCYELVSSHSGSPLVRVWDLRSTRRVVARLPGHASPVVGLAADGAAQIASLDGAGGLQLRRLWA